MWCQKCSYTVISSFLKDVVAMELRTSYPSSIGHLSYQRKRRSYAKSALISHQSSRSFTSSFNPPRTEKLDDLYIPFEESIPRHELVPLKARGLEVSNNTLPRSSMPQRFTQPRDPMYHCSNTARVVYRKSFEPDIRLRDGFYPGEGDPPLHSHFLITSDETIPGVLGRGAHPARSSTDLDYQGDASMMVDSKTPNAVVDVLVRLPQMDTVVPSVRVPLSQQRRKQNEGGSPSRNDSHKELRPSKQIKRLKTTETRNAASRKPEPWQAQKHALQEKFGPQCWSPRKRLSPDALEGIRALHAQYPEKFTTPVLANQFKISPEAIRRILRSKWRPDEVEEVSRRQRWDKRGESIWRQMVELGVKPPKRWREMGVTKTNAVRGSDRTTMAYRGRKMGAWNMTKGSRDQRAERNPHSQELSHSKPEEFLEERIL